MISKIAIVQTEGRVLRLVEKIKRDATTIKGGVRRLVERYEDGATIK
jgi:hypothetical protein